MKISLKNYNVESDKEYFLEVDIQYSEKLDDFLNDFPILPERTNIEKVEKLAANLHDKKEYVIHKRNLKLTWEHRLVLQKVQRVIKFNQEAWLKSCIDIALTEYRAKKKTL